MELGGTTYYFCSEHCLHAFEADPEKYLSGPAPAAHDHAAHALPLTRTRRESDH